MHEQSSIHFHDLHACVCVQCRTLDNALRRGTDGEAVVSIGNDEKDEGGGQREERTQSSIDYFGLHLFIECFSIFLCLTTVFSSFKTATLKHNQ